MQRQVTRVYAVGIGLLAVIGLFVTEGYLFTIMNTDPALDLLRIGLAALLIYAGFMSADGRLVRTTLMGVGALYVGMALLGLINSTLWGILPSGLTSFDIGFHLLTGVAALGVAFVDADRVGVAGTQE